jgi:hypothetical protein
MHNGKLHILTLAPALTLKLALKFALFGHAFPFPHGAWSMGTEVFCVVYIYEGHTATQAQAAC